MPLWFFPALMGALATLSLIAGGLAPIRACKRGKCTTESTTKDHTTPSRSARLRHSDMVTGKNQ